MNAVMSSARPGREVGEISIGRFTIPYRVYGQHHEQEPPIICVNGAQQSMAAWRSFLSHFRFRSRVVVFDFPGQGRAHTRCDLSDLSLDDQVDILARVIDETASNGRVHIVSASWGGIVASALAAREQDRIERLLLGSFSVRANAALRELIDHGKSAIERRDRALCAQHLIESMASLVSDGLKDQIHKQFCAMSDTQLDMFYRHICWCRDIAIDDLVDFRRIRARTLITIGELDHMIDMNDVYRVAGLIPDCRVQLIPGAGHFLHFEQNHLISLFERFFCSPS